MVELGDPNGDVVGEGVSGGSGYQTFFGFQLKFFSQEQVSLNFERHPQVEYFWQVGDAESCKQPGCSRLANTMNMERRWKDYALASHSDPPQCRKPDTYK